MILAVLAAATAVAAAPPQAEPMPNLYAQPAYCRAVVEKEVARQNVALKGRLRDGLQYAVLRKLDGCSVPTPVGYHPSLPPGAADPPAQPSEASEDKR